MTERNQAQATPEELLRAHYAWQKGIFVTSAEQVDGGIAAFSEITPIPMWNHAAWVGGADFNEFLAHVATWQSQRSRKPVVYIASPNAGQDEALRKAGFEKFDEEAWMVFVGNSPTTSPRVSPADSEAALDDFIALFHAAFSIKEEGYQRALRRADGLNHHFVLYDSDQPVSAGTLIYNGKLACIYNVGTPPRLRGKGYAREVVQHLTAIASRHGCQTIFLQVEHRSDAQRLYEKCGYRTAFVRVGYWIADWQASEISRTKLSAALRHRLAGGDKTYSRESRAIAAAVPPEDRGRIFAAAWAYLLHRYTGEVKVAFTLGETPVEVEIARTETVRNWLRRDPTPTSRADAGESLLCFHESAHFDVHFPLEVHVLATSVELLFRSDLFAKDAIRRMAAHLETIVESMLTNPDAQVGEIEILPASERHQLLVEWNQRHFHPCDYRVHQLFEAQVERTPEATALILAQAGVSSPAGQLTYRQLNRRANRLARRLQSMGIGPEVFVGVCLDRSLEMIISLLAILKAGGVYVPLDPAYPAERLGFILQDTKAPVLITTKQLARSFPAANVRTVFLDAIAEWAESERNLETGAGPEDAAYVIYTSGSTGQPKGVVVTHHAIANHSVDCVKVYGLSARDRVLQFSSFNFDASLEQILPCLISGATLVVRDDETWSIGEFEEKLDDLQLTVADIPTAYWHQLADEWSKTCAPRNVLRMVIVGGEALSPDKLALWQQTTMNTVRLINAYGPTEATITATSHEVPPRHNGEPPQPLLPIGRPRGDRTVYVLDPFGKPVPTGVPGELHIGGTLLARGYHNRSELTARKFISNPFSDEAGSRLYRTGDLVRYLEDGALEFLGRIDDQVKIRGFRIELGEIEECLRSHPHVRGALVLAREAAGEKRLVAYVEAHHGRPESRELREHTRTKLPDYMIPSAFVVLEKFPLLPSGKVDRRALPEPIEEVSTDALRGPHDPLELQLQLLFERVLKRAPIGVDVPFFELGGDSLQALELLVQIERATGQQLPLGTLYQSSTVEALANELRQRNSRAGWSSLVPLQTAGRRPPFFLLHTTPGDILGYGNLVYRLGPDQPCYGFQSLGLKDASLGHQSIEAMAEYYVRLLCEFQQSGPYYLGGWCYGGIVAVEMARLLRAAGREVALLALLETAAMRPALSNWQYYTHRLACFARMSPSGWLTYFREKKRYVNEARVANRMRFRKVDRAGAPVNEPRLALLEQVYNTNMQALGRYRSSCYDGKVVLFNAAERDPALIPDRLYGWVGLAREIEIHEVPGNHDTMLTEPNVAVLAAKISECLDQARANFEGRNE